MSVERNIKDVVIIGADLAGYLLALFLARRNVSVVLFTPESHISFDNIPEGLSLEMLARIDRQDLKENSFLRKYDSFCAGVTESVCEGLRLQQEDFLDRPLIDQMEREITTHPLIECCYNTYPMELFTLEKHSQISTDAYRFPSVFGLSVFSAYDRTCQEYLAREIVIATGGIAGLYLNYQGHEEYFDGTGLLLAKRAGARLIHMDHIQFISTEHGSMYRPGGIAVDEVGSTQLHRLRAIGDVTKNGLVYPLEDRVLNFLDKVEGAFTMAADLSKQLERLLYYFPRDFKSIPRQTNTLVENYSSDWKILRTIMETYVKNPSSSESLHCAFHCLQGLAQSHPLIDSMESVSMEKWRLVYGIQAALLIVGGISSFNERFFYNL